MAYIFFSIRQTYTRRTRIQAGSCSRAVYRHGGRAPGGESLVELGPGSLGTPSLLGAAKWTRLGHVVKDTDGKDFVLQGVQRDGLARRLHQLPKSVYTHNSPGAENMCRRVYFPFNKMAA
uniref:Uncharacterized protein n=1 Tax=Timema tahoe TaxID=61484 RepID=A0A7R9FMC8_9NEOP|nr:unnamed protein product [Timema tahoe]